MTDDIEEDEIEYAKGFLVDTLAKGPIKLKTAMRKAGNADIRWRAVIRARQAMGLQASRDKTGEWFWTLPKAAKTRAGQLAA